MERGPVSSIVSFPNAEDVAPALVAPDVSDFLFRSVVQTIFGLLDASLEDVPTSAPPFFFLTIQTNDSTIQPIKENAHALVKEHIRDHRISIKDIVQTLADRKCGGIV